MAALHYIIGSSPANCRNLDSQTFGGGHESHQADAIHHAQALAMMSAAFAQAAPPPDPASGDDPRDCRRCRTSYLPAAASSNWACSRAAAQRYAVMCEFYGRNETFRPSDRL